ncbi:DUF3040 domain-containing protein [Actinoplanes utahensis]|uniref:Uncharacterized protein n=1 Tax=Actinoplanes utahensis TaxID=1869 RepID=A0A0A6ULC3_ACTUT|nr:DUF3040 domain-containing protein [Actinoplanes utahensis]KHD76925.1 hypothetical protein MB27_14040 [Actinoplanes utahensis]GIF27315.1 hypothetical protein Aut01nite_03010 [Actinoplanes utahensis]
MLEERDRRALADIEQRLAAEDPDFVRRMQGDRPIPLIPFLCLAGFLALPFVATFLGPTAALILADVVGVAVVALLAYRHLRD